MRHIDDGKLKPGAPCPYCKEEEINSPLQESSHWCEPNIEDQWLEGFRDVLACNECGTYVVIEEGRKATEEPQVGEWWMCQSTDTLRTCPMVRVKDGWGSIQNAEGKALPAFVQKRPIIKPLYKMVRA